MTWASVAGAVVAGSGGLACGTCAIYCANLQTLVFQDASGAPLTPNLVVDGEVHACATDGGVASPFVTCTGNSLTYDMRSRGPHRIRAEATSGEFFEGELVPSGNPTSSCGCGGGDVTKPLTITLAR